MASYLFHLTRNGAGSGRSLREQAAELLDLKMWGVGPKAPNRRSLEAGDQVLIYLGAPEYEFVGSAEVASAVHEWTPDEAARFPGSFGDGVRLRDTRVWPHPVPMKRVLPQLTLKQTNPRARFFSGVVRLADEDYRRIIAAMTGDAASAAKPIPTRVARQSMPSPPAAERTPATPVAWADVRAEIIVPPRQRPAPRRTKLLGALRGLTVLLITALMVGAMVWLALFLPPGP